MPRLLLPLLLGKDLLELRERLVPGLRQGSHGKGGAEHEGARMQEEYALDPNQVDQIRKCLQYTADILCVTY